MKSNCDINEEEHNVINCLYQPFIVLLNSTLFISSWHIIVHNFSAFKPT